MYDYAMAEKIVVSENKFWTISRFRFFGNHPGSTTESTFADVLIRIYEGNLVMVVVISGSLQ